MNIDFFKKMVLPEEVSNILRGENIEIILPSSREHLLELSMGGKDNETFDVSYKVDDKLVREAYITKCKNGLVANYDDIYMRRRDPNSMVIADNFPTDKPTHKERFGTEFDENRKETFKWLSEQDGLIVMPFLSGADSLNVGYQSLLIAPANAGFFALALSDLQGFIPAQDVPENFEPRAIVYVAPPFRYTHYDGKQVVVHNRKSDMHEIFSYNLYPGPSAKKGIYAVLLDVGEQEKWVTLHASVVKVVTPYELSVTIMHEGASGGGKSEMIEALHREADGRLKLGENIVTGEEYLTTISDTCDLYPVTDDMAMCHPAFLENHSSTTRKLIAADAESGWFLRVNHIDRYGTETDTEKNSIHPKKPILFFNLEATPNSTCLIWEHIQDSPGVPCPNPRIIMPKSFVNRAVDESVEVDIRSFGIRTPPTTKDNPSYGIIGLFHLLPPALAWIWRLVAPRGYANPSIMDSAGMQSEGVGSYWPFATGKLVDQANLLLKQILKTSSTRYVLIPNQYIGAYKVGFATQWAAREYLSRRGGAKFKKEMLVDSRCPLLGYTLDSMKIDGTKIKRGFLQVNRQNEVGEEAYDIGAAMLTNFFKDELKKYLTDDLLPLGREIIEACLNDASVDEYMKLTEELAVNNYFA